MNRREKEAWRLGIQEGYSNGYDEGYEKGFGKGVEKGRSQAKLAGRPWLEFLKVRCMCGCIIPYPVFKTAFSTEFRMPVEEKRRCPSCGLRIPEKALIKAYSKRGASY